jgi:hypothetical protein
LRVAKVERAYGFSSTALRAADVRGERSRN